MNRPGRGLLSRGLAIVLSAGIAGWLGAMLQPPVSVIRTVVVVALADDDASGERALATQFRMLTGRAVVVPVAERVATSPERLVAAIDAEADSETGLITIDVRDADATRALDIARQLLDTYLRTAYVSDVPADGLVRTRLLLPPHPVADPRAGPLAGLGIGAGIGVVAAMGAGIAGRIWRNRW